MAGKTSTLTVRIVSDAKAASAGFGQAESTVGRFTDRLDKASLAAGGVVAGLALAGKEAYQSASQLQQSAGAIESVFGASSSAVSKAAKAASTSVGLSANAYQEMAAVLGSQLKNMGFSADELAPKTADLIQLGADLSAVYGGPASDAIEAISALLRGETDPIERYGVSIKQSDINARLAAEGQDKLTGAAAKAAQAQAVLGLLAQQTGSAVGQFADQANTSAESTQIASAAYENAKGALGQTLLPAIVMVSHGLEGLASFAQNNSTAVGILAGVIGGLAVGVLVVNKAVAAYEAIAKAATVVQWLWNAAMDANPIGIIVLALAALVAGIVVAYQKFQWFRDLLSDIGNFFVSIWNWIEKVLDAVTFGGFGNLVGNSSHEWGAAPAGPAGGGMWGAVAPAGAWGATGGSNVGRLTPPTSAPARAGDTINITIQGAVDGASTADQVRGMLRKRDAQLGRTSVLSLGLSR